ncbi:Voltage-gated potassium channel subunit beta-3 [Merluccius polli]|uniref:Voltage-gated potassium channel subunit beta-3 n=1 Tax=Merluccius polli TaxID=89951 RepID=A0AA47P6D9_MERPO|nr:Voltage-gated potassium channel subunit beta-3 [Merluccius polli]
MSLAGTRTLVYRPDNLQRSALLHLDAHCDVLVLTQMTPQTIGEIETLLGNKPHSKKEAQA